MRVSKRIVATSMVMAAVSMWLVMSWPAGAAPITAIEVFRQSEVNKDEIFLKDISRVTGGDPALVRKIQGIEIGRSPLPGKSRSIEAAHLRIRLKQFDIDVSQVRVNVPENAEVVRGFARVAREQIQDVVVSYIRQVVYPRNEKRRVREVKCDKDVIVPKGPVSFTVEAPVGRDFSGNVPFAVNINVAGKFEKKVLAVADIEALKEVIVAKRPLGRYQVIRREDLEVQEVEMSNQLSGVLTDSEDILGKRTRKPIPMNTVLRSDMIEFPPLVKRGDVVVVLAESAGLRITALGIVKEREGREGERIRVENVESKRSIYGQVVDSKTVRVDF